jgi:hypothetical protein
MGEAGVFAPEARLELIEGEIIEMAPVGSPHAGMVNTLAVGATPNLPRREAAASLKRARYVASRPVGAVSQPRLSRSRPGNARPNPAR